MSDRSPASPRGADGPEDARRDFLYLTAGAMTTVGIGLSLWPFLKSMEPAADIRADTTLDVALGQVEPGQRVTVKWRNKPVFIVRRTAEEIARARADDNNPALIDPATDAERVQREEWLIVIGICTHLGCVPLGQRPGSPRSKYGGWYCACHGSEYDTVGRVRKGPAPRNLDLPPYEFVDNAKVRIG